MPFFGRAFFFNQSEMKRTFAIGDIHGCSKTLRKLVEELVVPSLQDDIIFVGDYIDRGPDSKGVLDYIIGLRQKGYGIKTLRGNHEQLLLDAFEHEENFEHWLMCGGDMTCRSFGIRDVHQLSDEYLSFVAQTEFYHMTDQYIIVHAGLSFASGNPFMDKDAMLWTRSNYVDMDQTGGRKIIHGHTPTPFATIQSLRDTNSINIDAGCVYTSRPGLGNLVAIELEHLRLLTVRNCD